MNLLHEIRMCLNGAVYCLEHDAAKETIAFTIRQLQETINEIDKMIEAITEVT